MGLKSARLDFSLAYFQRDFLMEAHPYIVMADSQPSQLS